MAAGSTIGLFQNFLILGALGIIFGKLQDIMRNVANQFQLNGDALNTLTWFGYMFVGFFILFFVGLLLNHLIESNNESSRGV
jgi:hypothetical protein